MAEGERGWEEGFGLVELGLLHRVHRLRNLLRPVSIIGEEDKGSPEDFEPREKQPFEGVVCFNDQRYVELTGAPFVYCFAFAVGVCFYSLLTIFMIYFMCNDLTESRSVALFSALSAFSSPLGHYSNYMFHPEPAVETFFVRVTLFAFSYYLVKEERWCLGFSLACL